MLFLGVRTYRLTSRHDGTVTGFQMIEEFTGALLPVVAGRLPDFGPIFRRYAMDLKAESQG